MRTRLMSFLAAAVLVAVASSGRRADAQSSFGGTLAGPHGTVSFRAGSPYFGTSRYGARRAPSYRYRAPYRYGSALRSYPRYSSYSSSYFPRRYRIRRIFVAFPFPHYVTQRIYFAPTDPYCGY